MKNYKMYPKTLIGQSDFSALTVSHFDGKEIKLDNLYFGEDGAYSAYIVDEEAKIPECYKVQIEQKGEGWLRIMDDVHLTYKTTFEEGFKIYRSGNFGCIIQILNKRKEDNMEVHYARFYSHDYPNDTILKFDKVRDMSELKLAFTSEDPDYGIEELRYDGKGENMVKTITDLLDKISEHLDRECEMKEFEDFMPTSLYAFEAVLTQTLKEIAEKKGETV